MEKLSVLIRILRVPVLLIKNETADYCLYLSTCGKTVWSKSIETRNADGSRNFYHSIAACS